MLLTRVEYRIAELTNTIDSIGILRSLSSTVFAHYLSDGLRILSILLTFSFLKDYST